MIAFTQPVYQVASTRRIKYIYYKQSDGRKILLSVNGQHMYLRGGIQRETNGRIMREAVLNA